MELRLNVTNKSAENKPVSNADLEMQRRSLNAALDRLNRAERHSHVHSRGRLIFALDLTESRETTLIQGRIAIEAMFDALTSIGKVRMMFAWFRGTDECRKSQWYDNPSALSPSMRKLRCEFGRTQIARLIRMAIGEGDGVSGMVYVGDHCEEDPKMLYGLAESLGKVSIPLFIFHECKDDEYATVQAKPIFAHMAELSGGAYMEFKPDSGTVLREALTSLGAFSVAGSAGVRQIAKPNTPEALQLHGRLLMGTGR